MASIIYIYLHNSRFPLLLQAMWTILFAMQNSRSFYYVATILFLLWQSSICSSALAAPVLAPGIYLPRDYAIELRSSGQLRSLCDQARAQQGPLIHALRVDQAGQIFVYDPFLKESFQTRAAPQHLGATTDYLPSSTEEVELDLHAQANCFGQIDGKTLAPIASDPKTTEEALAARRELMQAFVIDQEEGVDRLLGDSLTIDLFGASVGATLVSGFGAYVGYSGAKELDEILALKNKLWSLRRQSIQLSASAMDEIVDRFLTASHKMLETGPKLSDEIAGALGKRGGPSTLESLQVALDDVITERTEALDRVIASAKTPDVAQTARLRKAFLVGKYSFFTLFVASLGANVYYASRLAKEGREAVHLDFISLSNIPHSRQDLVDFLALPEAQAKLAIEAWPNLAKYLIQLSQQTLDPVR